MIVTCAVCGKQIERKPSQVKRAANSYCSTECANIGLLRGKEVTCDWCGATFFKSPSQVHESNFCSNACRRAWMGKRNKEIQNVPRRKMVQKATHNSSGTRNRTLSNAKMVTVECTWCGQTFQKRKADLHEHNFCCKEHFYQWAGKRLSEYDRTENPMNKPGGVPESRIRRSEHLRGSGEGKSYPKYLGKHAHRMIAEILIGRPLRPGEIVHHIDGDKLNNDPENIQVLPSQSVHCKVHGFGTAVNGNKHRKERKGDADAGKNDAANAD